MTQNWNAAAYEQNGRFVADLAGDVFRMLGAHPGERILDLGCGDGALSLRIVQTGATVLGLDGAPDMVNAARARGIDAHAGDGQRLEFHHEFDAVFSNAALHWMADQDAVLRGVNNALRPGGRFVAELGGHGNIAAIRTALRAVVGPLGLDAEHEGQNVFFRPEEYREMLEIHGFIVAEISLVPRPTLLPTGIPGWLETFRRGLLDRLPPSRRQEVIAEVTELLRPILCDRSGNWYADYVRLRFRAETSM